MEETKYRRVRITPQNLKHNMFISVEKQDGTKINGYFKRYFYKNLQIADVRKQNVYREEWEELLKLYQTELNDLYVFMSDTEIDSTDPRQKRTFDSC